MRDIGLVLIGINVGVAVGWILCKKFNGNISEVMKWLNGE